MSQLISIGRFALLADLSPKTLRQLDERGLLTPAYVDPVTRYRYYDYGQLRRASLIHLCRQLRVPLSQVGALVAAGDPAAIRRHLEHHRAKLAADLAERNRLLGLVDQELARAAHPLTYTCALKDVPAQLVAARSGHVPRRHPHDPMDVERALRLTAETVFRWVADHGVRPDMHPLIHYFNDMRRDEDVSFEICCPLDAAVPEGGGVTCRTLPPVRVAFTVHHGNYYSIWNAYAELRSWVDEQGLVVDGPTREIGLVHGLDTSDPSQWVTEIAYPVVP